jgi:hypothetical protein
MPTKPLPIHPSLAHLKQQAKDLLRSHRLQTMEASQRIREFHPRFRSASDAEIANATFALSDALLTIAREYGFPSWPRLKAYIESPHQDRLTHAHHERIEDAAFRRAVELLDAGKIDELRTYLAAHPDVVRQRVTFDGGNYFSNPTLLEFVAENPTRHGRLPANIVDIARAILDAGAKDDKAGLDSTLALAGSSRVARECGVQRQLIDLLCDYGANACAAIYPALLYGEFDAVDALIRRGAKVDLVVAAATGRYNEAVSLLGDTDAESRQRALALAAQHGRVDVVRLLLDAGVDPDRYAPVGGHSHATPLHQAVAAGQEPVVRLLVERGARLDIRDIHHHATPKDWAVHFGREELASYLESASS